MQLVIFIELLNQIINDPKTKNMFSKMLKMKINLFMLHLSLVKVQSKVLVWDRCHIPNNNHCGGAIIEFCTIPPQVKLDYLLASYFCVVIVTLL